MTELSQETLQCFSDQVAEICQTMGLQPEEMLEAIGSTWIGAMLSFGKTSFQVDVSGVATAIVKSVTPWEEDEEFRLYLAQQRLAALHDDQIASIYTKYQEERGNFSSIEDYIEHTKQCRRQSGQETLDTLFKNQID